MTTYIALLRGINVGKAKRVAMADLRALMEGLGHTDVATVLMSGNVIFASSRPSGAALAKGIEDAIATRLAMDVRVLVRTAAEVRAVVEDNPFGAQAAKEANRLQVTFFDGAPDRSALRAVLESDWSPEAVALGTGALYAWQPHGMTGSKLGEALAKVPGPVTTTRNLATLEKLLAKI